VTDWPRPEPLHRTVFSGGALDRLHDRRTDPDWLVSAGVTNAVVHLVWQGQVAITPDRTVHRSSMSRIASFQDRLVFLGDLGGTVHWTADVSDLTKDDAEALLEDGASFIQLRDAGAMLSEDDGNVLSFAAGMGYWHRTHAYCGSCGAPTEATTGGHERKCTSCGQVHWPRTDPAVIMLVVDEPGDRALLGRQKIWPKNMFSTLAGFVEPGESLEDAVARETWEEAAIRVGAVRYWCSQPWPFPRSVMLGFHAAYHSGEVTPHPNELDDAKWFSRQELLDAREMGMRAIPMIPPPVTIARALIDAWLDGRVNFRST
jgi:NAD+ diphosphatase